MAIDGSTVFVGRGCNGDATIPAAPTVGGPFIAVVERGDCTFQEKVQNIVDAGGYSATIIFNREGDDACNGIFSPFLTVTGMPVVFIGREAGFEPFDLGASFNLSVCLAGDGSVQSGFALGSFGDVVMSVSSTFDGWGYVRLFDATNQRDLVELDQFAIPESTNAAFAEDFGDLSVHEVAVDPLDASLAYLSYYSGGVRMIDIRCSSPADSSTCELVEVGGYLGTTGNDVWGVETFVRGGQTYVLASDRDFGLLIFQTIEP